MMTPQCKNSDANEQQSIKYERTNKPHGENRKNKNTIFIQFSALCTLRHPLEVLSYILHGYGRLLYN
jgi:hypothetical protein